MRVGMSIASSAVAVALIYWGISQKSEPEQVQDSNNLVTIDVPDTLTANAQIGKTMFASKCAACHGENAVGRDEIAPPLIHRIYEPSHHGNEAFQRAVASGVRSHHWRFGNMQPVEGLTRGDVAMIIAFVRELQRANGIN